MKHLLLTVSLILIALSSAAQKYGSPSIDIIYLLSVQGNDTVFLATERPKVEFEKEKKSLWAKAKDKTSEIASNTKDAAAEKGWISHKATDTVAAPRPDMITRLDSVPLVTRSFKALGAKSSCVGEANSSYCLIVRSNHSYVNPRELVQILPLNVAAGERLYTLPARIAFTYCDSVDKYDANGSYICHISLDPGEYAITVADQPTLVQFFSIP